jgi:hypothetical protein
MKKISLSVVSILFLVLNTKAQLDPIKQMELNSSCESVYLHSGTGIPIFKTQSSYVAIHPVTFEPLWEIKRKGVAVASEVTSGESYSDYFELPATNIVFVGNDFVEVIHGKVLVDGDADELRSISTFHIFPAKDLLIVKTIVKGHYRLYGFNTINNSLLWKTDIDDLGNLSLASLGDSDPVTETTNGLKPYIEASGDIIYVHQKNMMLIDPATGQLKWTQPLEPGAILFSKSGKLIAVAERRSGLGTIVVSGDPKFGKKLTVVDAMTGENAWKKEIKLDGNILFIQPYKDGFIAAHEEGFNIYDFNSTKAEPQWKKDFAAKEISDIVEDGDNIMVYYKDRRMLMDPVTGDDVWKKPEKLEEEVPVFTGGGTLKVGDVEVTKSGTSVRLHNTKTNAYRFFPSQTFEIDRQKNAVVGVNAAKSDLPAGIDYRFYHADLNTMKVSSARADLKGGFRGIHVSPNGYFVHSTQGFIMAKMDAGKLVVTREEKYPDPTAFERNLLELGREIALTNYVIGGAGFGPAYLVGDEASFKSYANRMTTSYRALEAMSYINIRANMARIDNTYAFFFSRDDDGHLALFQIKKDDGTETARYKFDDKTPSYEIDYTNGQLYYMNGKMLKIFKLAG